MQTQTCQQILKKIEEREARLYGGKLQPPCSLEGLERLRRRARLELGFDIPEDYASFLAQHDGLDWNGVVFHASETAPIVGYSDRFLEGLVEANLGYRDVERLKRFLVLGASGMELYVYEPSRREYSVRDSVSLDVYEVYSSFDELIVAVLSGRIEDSGD